MPTKYGKDYLVSKLNKVKHINERRYSYYENDNPMKRNSFTLIKKQMQINEKIGWCAKAVDTIANRLNFREFENDNFDMNEIFRMNNSDILFDNAILSALITSCSFVYIFLDEDNYPRLQVIDGRHATGIIDQVTNMLTEGYAILETDKNDMPTIEAYFEPGAVTYYETGREAYTIYNNAQYCTLVPIIFRPDAKKPFGHSKITKASMNIVDRVLRTLERSEVSAEFYSFPQKYVSGLSDESEFDSKQATISSFLNFGKDDEGDSPKLGQFTQQSMEPYLTQLKSDASLFAGETGLTLDDLGFSTDNPSSVEAIKAQHENLRLEARKAQKTFGVCFLNVGFIAACLRDAFPYNRYAMYRTTAKWEPIFEPDGASLSVIGDGAIKINQAIPGYFSKDTLRDLTGIDFSSETSNTSIDNVTEENINE